MIPSKTRISTSWTTKTLLSVDLSASARLSLNLHFLEHGVGHAFGVVSRPLWVGRPSPDGVIVRGRRLFYVRLSYAVTASGADDDVLADAYHSESLRAYARRPAFVVRSAFDLGGKSLRSGSGSTSSASTTGAASPPPSTAGVCHSSSGTPRCARDSARGPLVMSSKMTSNGRDPYRIAIGLPPSPVSCGNKPDRMGALSAGAQFGQHRVIDRRLCLHEAADRTDRAYHPGVHSAPA